MNRRNRLRLDWYRPDRLHRDCPDLVYLVTPSGFVSIAANLAASIAASFSLLLQ
jgi:hypothetical protein